MHENGANPPPRAPRRATRIERALAAFLAIAALFVLTLAWTLDPDPAGYGTHESLKLLTPCPWPILFDKPCPTCGMTTAFAHAADADFVASFATQPFGMLLAVAGATTFWLALHVAIFGSRLSFFIDRLLRPRAVLAVGLLALAAWIYKILTF